jgi:hypothetical protein
MIVINVIHTLLEASISYLVDRETLKNSNKTMTATGKLVSSALVEKFLPLISMGNEQPRGKTARYQNPKVSCCANTRLYSASLP